jgi:hypothetical protein
MSVAGSSAAAADAATERPVRRIALNGAKSEQRAALMAREWLVTNGLGGYAAERSAGPRHAAIMAFSLQPWRRRTGAGCC